MRDRFTHTNSKGEVLDFVELGIYINYNDLRNYEWEVMTDNNRITGFRRGIATKTIPLVFAVNEAQATEIKNAFYEHFDIDVLTQREGFFTIGEYKYYCYIVKSLKTDYLVSKRHLIVTLEVTSDKNYWYKEKETSIDFTKQTEEETGALKYAFKYPFVYGGINNVNVLNESFVESDAIIRMWGEVVNPLLRIGDNVYQVNDTLSENEYIEINTGEKTVYKCSNFGERTNIFEKRNKQYNIFKPIPSGSNIVSTNDKMKVDVVLIEKRSEPKWT